MPQLVDFPNLDPNTYKNDVARMVAAFRHEDLEEIERLGNEFRSFRGVEYLNMVMGAALAADPVAAEIAEIASGV